MKNKIQFFLFAIGGLVGSVTAQNTVNATGKTLVSNQITYAYSVGEVTAFSLNEHCIYTPGVIQPTKISIRAPYQQLFDNFHEALLYPNPTTGIVIIETNDPDISMYQVAAYDGRIVQMGKFNYISINLKALPGGLYLLTLFSKEHKIRQTFKIIKL